MSDLGPLRDGARIVVVGGGPGGSACALSLLRGARASGRRVEVSILEPKRFGVDHNQCAGVLSPPIQAVLHDELDVDLPEGLLQRQIRGYALHGATETLDFPLGGGEVTFALRRMELDAFLLGRAAAAGARVVQARAHDVEIRPAGVTVYTDGGSFSGDVLVGAFGLDPTLGTALRRRVGYRRPPQLETVVTKFHPAGLDPLPNLLGDTVHAFMPAVGRIDFGALIPKGNHITVVVAGHGVGRADLEAFLSLAPVFGLVGQRHASEEFTGAFPNGLAGNSFGDRFVTVGDAAGLVRPLKGKGIYTSTISGIRAAQTMLECGISRVAFEQYRARCQDLVSDVRYGTVVRALALLMSKRVSMDPVIARARSDASLRRAMFLAVSGHGSSREIFRLGARPDVAAGLAASLLSYVAARAWRGAVTRPGSRAGAARSY